MNESPRGAENNPQKFACRTDGTISRDRRASAARTITSRFSALHLGFPRCVSGPP